MQEYSSQKAVSRSHTDPIPEKNYLESKDIKAVTQKKAKLQEALSEFDRDETISSNYKKSILSDKGNVLQVGKENQGTIIKDVKRNRWSFTHAIKKSLAGWFLNNTNRLVHILKKPTPKKVIETSNARIETIKKASHLSAIADDEFFKKSTLDNGLKKSNSSIRIKPKDIPKEIGNTKPHWTHIIEEDEYEIKNHNQVSQPPETISIPKSPISKSFEEKPKQLDAPDKKLLLPQKVATIKRDSIKKEYRTPRIINYIAKPQNLTPTGKDNLTNANVSRSYETTPKIHTKQETSSAAKSLLENETKSDSEKKSVLQTSFTPSKSTEKKVTAKQTPTADRHNVFASILTNTFVMTLIFIAILIVSILTWKIIENKPNLTSVTNLEQGDLIKADATQIINETTLDTVITTNKGFTKFTPTNPNDFRNFILSWNELLRYGVIDVEIGAINSKPFIAIQTDSKETALVSMLAMETNLPTQLVNWFAISSSARFINSSLGSYTVRILKDSQSVYLVYFIRDDGLILIANNTSDMTTLIDRAK